MLDDLITDLNGMTVFSKLDLTNAYHQLELDKESRYVTTFTTHVGLSLFGSQKLKCPVKRMNCTHVLQHEHSLSMGKHH